MRKNAVTWTCVFVPPFTVIRQQHAHLQGGFKIFSVITNIYNMITRGPTLMELFTATWKLKFFWHLKMFDLCTMGDTAHMDTMLKFLPHTHTHINIGAPMLTRVARTWISFLCVPCHPWCKHRTPLGYEKKNFQLSCGCEQFH
jgi:hypothetical protein